MSPHVRYDILLANLYFKNIHQSEDFQEERRPRHELGSVVVGRRWGVVGGRRGRKGGVGKPIHLSLQALAGATAAALQRRKRRRRREGCSICGSSTSESGGQVKKAREGWLLFRGSSTVHKHLCPRIQLRCLPKLPPPGRRAAAKGATDKSAAAGSKFNTFPVSPCLPCCRGSNANLGRTQ